MAESDFFDYKIRSSSKQPTIGLVEELLKLAKAETVEVQRSHNYSKPLDFATAGYIQSLHRQILKMLDELSRYAERGADSEKGK